MDTKLQISWYSLAMLSLTTEYALRAVVFLAENPESEWTIRKIAEATQVPSHYLAKVLRSLAREGLVRARPGLRGGFTLARDPGEITMYDIVDAVTPLRRIEGCPLGRSEHTEELCPLHDALDKAAAEFVARLSGITIEGLCADAAKHFDNTDGRAEPLAAHR